MMCSLAVSLLVGSELGYCWYEFHDACLGNWDAGGLKHEDVERGIGSLMIVKK